MTSPHHLRTPALVAALALLLPALALLTPGPAPSSAAAPQPSLSVSPQEFIGGQQVTFAGNIGRLGRRAVRLQHNLGRPGDPWQTIPGTRHTTKANGDFSFGYRAPSMYGKYLRVAAKGGLHTPAEQLYAKGQDHVVWAGSRTAPNEVVAGEDFTIHVDTTPTSGREIDQLMGRGGHLPPPPLPGRVLTLQRRVPTGLPFGYGDQWQDVDTGAAVTTDSRGEAEFGGLRVDTPGTVVYRVVQEDWTRNGDNVGWMPSFPTYVDVLGSAGSAAVETTARQPVRTTATTSTTAPTTAPRTTAVGSKTAAERYEWRPSLWGYAWGYGESLTTRPADGTDRVGWWREAASGTGRTAKHNGGLLLDTQRQNVDDHARIDVDDSYGATAATLRANPMRYGRWELRLRTKSTEKDDADVRVLLELVPDDPADYAYGARNITIAEVSPHGSTVRIAASNADGKHWSRTVRDVRTNGVSHAFAIEVGKRHLTWFREGRPIGTVKSAAAVPDVPMTLRMSIVPAGGMNDDRELDRTQAIFDWMRGYRLGEGRQVKSGTALQAG
jgi:hypothetical protein